MKRIAWSFVWLVAVIGALYMANVAFMCGDCPQSCSCVKPFVGLGWMATAGVCATIAMILAWRESRGEEKS